MSAEDEYDEFIQDGKYLRWDKHCLVSAFEDLRPKRWTWKIVSSDRKQRVYGVGYKSLFQAILAAEALLPYIQETWT